MATRRQSRPAESADRPVRVTLRDVAVQSGLSLGTVSRILNGGNKSVWASTASRETNVRKIAEKLGYKPNFSARSLRSQKSHTIALVYGLASPLLYGAYEAMASSIVGVLEEYRYHLLFLPLPPESRESWPLDLLRNGRVDGCIAMDPLPQVVVEALQESGLPFFAINVDRDVPVVRPDDVDGVQQAIDHLVQLGHRRIAFYAGQHPHGIHFSLTLRQASYQREMQARGLGEHGFVSEDEVDAFVDRWRAMPPTRRPTAVIVYQGLQALPIQKRFLDAGVRIPRDLSLLTFDDLPVMQWLTPAMTAIDVPIVQMGEFAANQLLGRLERGEPLASQTTLMPERLIARESTARIAST